jgi:phospholipid/cholesterol/gamma-HCH transport system substrate-binding protein
MSDNRPIKSKARKEPFHYKHRSVFVSLFITVPIAVVIGFVAFKLVKTDFLENWCDLHVRYESGQGLDKGKAVMFKGTRIGRIRSVALNYQGDVDCVLQIKREFVHFVRTNSVAKLKQANPLVGDYEIELTQGDSTKPIVSDGDTLKPGKPMQMDAIIAQATVLLEQIGEIVTGINEGKGSVGKALKEDTLITGVYQTIQNTNVLLAKLNRTVAKTDDVFTVVEDLNASTTRIIDSVTTVMGNVNRLLTSMNNLVGNADSLATDAPMLLEDVQREMMHVEMMLQALRNNWLIKRGISKQPDPLLTE